MNLLFRPTNPFRLSTPFNTISILSKPTHHTSSTMRNLTPSRTIHAHTHIHRHSTSQAGRRPLTAVALGLGGAIPFFAQGRPTWNDVSPAALSDSAVFSSSAGNNGTKKNVPVLKGGKLNPDAVKQISFGGMLGLGLGVLFSMLSRMLVLVLGIGVVVWQVSLIFALVDAI